MTKKFYKELCNGSNIDNKVNLSNVHRPTSRSFIFSILFWWVHNNLF